MAKIKDMAQVQETFLSNLNRISSVSWVGHVRSIVGLLVEVVGITHCVRLGSMVRIWRDDHHHLLGEVVGFRQDVVLVMGYDFLDGIGPKAKVNVIEQDMHIYPCDAWRGRIVDGLARPVDNKGPLLQGTTPYFVKSKAPEAHQRARTTTPVDLGIKAMNTFTTCYRGQRMGIFSAAGVGKSILLGQITRFTDCDIIIVGLVGERGREVKEFIEDQLGDEGLAKAVVVVATSDMPALLRRQAAYITFTLAEYFRDQQLNVLCVVDSVTRFALAQREIGLSVSEPPATRGFPPTVFSELPRLLERAGNTHHAGSITGIFSILVEGDDHNEPIADAVRSILDGHIVLDRSIAERGRYPAINILKSVSRARIKRSPEDEQCIEHVRRVLSTYENMAEMIQLGAYQQGQSPDVDKAIADYPKIESFLSQDKDTAVSLEEGFAQLKAIVNP
ncbi:FliI/YscN family ATPase [Candidatus Hepatobacter penaei]|uniref:FliI/YscN family ATPase n=1 Tax=Candidatus Hepatobacter penaei TaxID=1274402 RepID=UPI000A8BEC1F|nr:FliI/YscN family ATPase [Candidatus Hepatobacter penaei]